MLSIKTTQTNPNYAHDLETVVKALTDKEVVAGFPKGQLNTPYYEFKWSKRKIRNKEPYPSIIDVAIKNNFGIGVPRREFMAKASEEWEKTERAALEQVQDGMAKGQMDVDKFMDVMGQDGANLISEAIENWTTPPNSAYTKHMKMSDHPLIDSGDMKNAPRHEIRRVVK